MLTQDLFQPKYQFNVQIKLYNKIIKHFPDLSTTKAQIIARAIVNKLCEGVEYPNQLEDLIQKIYPTIISDV